MYEVGGGGGSSNSDHMKNAQAMAPPMQVGGSDRTARTSALGETFINVRDELSRFAGKEKDGLGELNKFAGGVKEFFAKERQDGKASRLGDARQ